MSMRLEIVVSTFVFCGVAFSQSSDPDRGGAEIRGFIGTAVNASSILANTSKVGAGVEGAFDLNRYIAVTGNYTWDRLGISVLCFTTICTPPPDETVHEFLGGVRLSLPHRVTPYFSATAGGVRLANFGSNSSGESSEFAFGLGAGMNIRITHKTGIGLDLRGVKAVSSNLWLVQPSAGFYFRF